MAPLHSGPISAEFDFVNVRAERLGGAKKRATMGA
jgi:hypothetical protein